MAKSIAEQVAEFLDKNPSCTNPELYEAFPKVRANTLRHYKSKFGSADGAGKKTGTKAKKATTSDLEARVAALEEQVERLTQMAEGKKPFKGAINVTTEVLDKIFKDLEENITGFVKSKVPHKQVSDFNFEELQQLITGKFNQIIQSLKKGNKS